MVDTVSCSAISYQRELNARVGRVLEALKKEGFHFSEKTGSFNKGAAQVFVFQGNIDIQTHLGLELKPYARYAISNEGNHHRIEDSLDTQFEDLLYFVLGAATRGKKAA